jgi:hypothetical protein
MGWCLRWGKTVYCENQEVRYRTGWQEDKGNQEKALEIHLET